MKTGKLLAFFGLAASCFALFVFALTPTIVQFVIEGNVVELTEIPNIYNSTDLVVIGFSSFVLGSSLVYLLLVDKNNELPTKISLVKEKWDKLLVELADTDEQVIVRIVVDDGGTIFQSQLVEKSGFSKSKVSLILDKLEARRILERKRRGMTNVVVLK
ncbi:MAG: hypothetical protein NWE84_05625 [Candidatus Bathyarchaeota archaeon]|nr:hypothetical protein [Candidatus Bathyarchaeota archaeon]